MVGVRTNGPGRRWLTMAIAAKSGRFSPFVSGMLVKRLARLFAAFGLVTVAAYAASDSASPTLQFISRGKSNRIIVFVDGLTSDPDKTFRWGQGVPSWPELMAADTTSEKKQLPLSRYDVAELSFKGAAEGQRTVPQLATKALGELKAKGVLDGYDSISFVAYSAGGLVLKSMLIQTSISGSPALTAKTKTVFLLSVPAQGKAASDFLSLLSTQKPLVASFSGSDVPVFLQGLESLWSEYLATRSPTRPLKIYCLHETEPTFGAAVKPGQFAAEGCDDSGEQSGADHITIAKPGSREAGAYKWVEGKLADYFQRFPSDPGKPKPGATPTVAVAANDPAVTSSTKPAAVVSPQPLAAANATQTPNTPIPPTPPDAAVAATLPAPTAPAAPVREVAAVAALPSAPLPAYRPSLPPAQAAPTRTGDWTFSLHGADCNLTEQLWVVKIEDRKIGSENWKASVGDDGKFSMQQTSSCATELVRGSISGKRGSGWYLYADPCSGSYCRVRFKMTWRQPVEAWKKSGRLLK